MKKEVKIGIFAVLMICCAWAGIRFLSGIDIFNRNVNYYASYDNINGIQNASAVMVQGVKVGSVTAINLDPSNSDKVVLTLSIKHQYQIPSDTEAKIFSPGIMSSMAIGLTLGKSASYLKDGDMIKSGVEKGLMDMAGPQLEVLTTQLSNVSEKLTQTLTSVNTLLSTNQQNINKTLDNVNALSTNLNLLLANERKNMELAIEGFSELSQTLGNNSNNIDSILLNVNTLTTQLADANLGESLSATLAELNTTLATLNSAEGSVGMLLNDEALYNNLASASENLSTLLGDLQENPKRYVHFSLFGRKDKSAE